MTTDDKLAVSQEAREAAADYYDARFPKERTLAPMMRAGRADGSMTVQTFARFEAQARLAGERIGMERAAGMIAKSAVMFRRLDQDARAHDLEFEVAAIRKEAASIQGGSNG